MQLEILPESVSVSSRVMLREEIELTRGFYRQLAETKTQTDPQRGRRILLSTLRSKGFGNTTIFKITVEAFIASAESAGELQTLRFNVSFSHDLFSLVRSAEQNF